MADYIEARSLASLNALANNPPQYPTNPTAKREEPLTLYISRVPGTRDIILSTFKPQIKNVTADDVAGSLYYVHLNTPEDELLISDSPQEASSRPSLDSARSGNLLNRKPVAAAPNASNLSRSPEPAMQVPEIHLAAPDGQDAQPYPAQAPDFQRAYTADSLRSHRPPPLPIHRKPLVPRDVAVRTDAPPTPPPHQYMDIPNLPPRPDEIDNYPEYGSNPLSPSLPMRLPSPSKRKHFTPFSLTLIRRDRTSHQQWNVGRISSFQFEHPEQLPDDKYTPAPSISIQLETPGYSKFRGMPAFGAALDIRDIRESLDMIRPGFSPAAGMASPVSPHRPRPKPVEPVQTHAHTLPPSAHIFERKVEMAYSPSWTASIRKAFKHRESREDDLLLSPRRPDFERQISSVSVGSAPGDLDSPKSPVVTSPGHGLKPQGYTFLSPWDGRCEFRTGNAGRSLRCRHILPTHANQWNPLTDGADEGAGGGKRHRRNGSWSPKPKGNDISELRFNLPSAEIFNTKPTDQYGPHEARERTRDKIFNAMINKSEYDDDDEYDALGSIMNLGREKAGGGNRGKRAKMGKLIIWDEGLKMLDLVVAANVGVWWNVWERKAD